MRLNPRRKRNQLRIESLETRRLLAADIVELASNLEDVSPNDMVQAGSNVYFSADNGPEGQEIWASGGTVATTGLVTEVVPGDTGNYARPLTDLDGQLIYGHSNGLYATDGTAASTQTLLSGNRSFLYGLSTSSFALLVDNNAGNDDTWATDGTPAGTVLVSQAFESTYDGIVVNDTPYLVAFDSPSSTGQIWTSDGTAAGTRLVSSVAGSINGLESFQGDLLFLGRDNSPGSRELTLYRLDLDTESTTVVGTVPVQQHLFNEAAVLNNQYIFSVWDAAVGAELYVSDGVGSISLLADLVPGSQSSSPRQFTTSNGMVFFTASTASGESLWVTDGTASGTEEILSGLQNIDELQAIDGGVAFIGGEGVRTEMWVSNGTAQGTVRATSSITDDPTDALGGVISINAFGGEVYFITSSTDTITPAFMQDVSVASNFDFAPLVDFRIDENAATGLVVGDAIPLPSPFTPADIGFIDFQIDSGNTDGAFAIDSVTGQITVANPAALDFETNPVFELIVLADQGFGAEPARYRIELNDLSEGGPVTLVDGELQVTGTDGEDDVTIVNDDGVVTVQYPGLPPQIFDIDDIDELMIQLGDGDDEIVVTGFDVPVTIDGGLGDDILDGSQGDDILIGGGGNDRIEGDGGDDLIIGNSGDDTLIGGAGNDFVKAGSGDDFVFGGSGSDVVRGGGGNDRVFGGSGGDLLIGGRGTDNINAGRGGDILIGGRASASDADLALVIEEWTAQRSYAARTSNILNGTGPILGGVSLIPGVNVHDDNSADTLRGSIGRDWYFAERDGLDSDDDQIQGFIFFEDVVGLF